MLNMEKIKLKEAIMVEGRYDKSNILNYVDTLVITTDGFGIFKSRDKRDYIKKISDERGLIILTDSDSSGFLIRNHIKSFTDPKNIKNAFIPEIKGKESRKKMPSSENKLGVEAMTKNIILKALESAGATFLSIDSSISRFEDKSNKITAADLYRMGLIGSHESRKKRKELTDSMNLPEHINTKDLIRILNLNNME